jgi:glycosyltransferase involved in cell wall biosynthesis
MAINNKIPVSVIIPVKNEEKNLPRCLSLLSDFSEVIVVDSNSTDNTIKIVKSFGFKFVNFCWNGKFPKKRNWTLKNIDIKNEWVLFLDADEYVTSDFKTELVKQIILNKYNGFWIKYNNHFLGKRLKYGIKMRKLSLFKKDKGEYEFIDENFWSNLDMEIHEHPIIQGKIGIINTPLVHEDFKGLPHYLKKHNEYSTWEANRYLKLSKLHYKTFSFRQKLKYKFINSWYFSSIYFFLNYIIYLGFLDGRIGYIFSQYKKQYFFNIKTKIFELENKRS